MEVLMGTSFVSGRFSIAMFDYQREVWDWIRKLQITTIAWNLP